MSKLIPTFRASVDVHEKLVDDPFIRDRITEELLTKATIEHPLSRKQIEQIYTITVEPRDNTFMLAMGLDFGLNMMTVTIHIPQVEI